MQQHSQQRQQQRDQQHSQQRSQRHCCGQRADFWIFSAAAVNNGADAADSYFTAFPQSMMVFTGMAVLGVILPALMFPFSPRPPPGFRGVK